MTTDESNPVVAALLGPVSRRSIRIDIPMTDEERELDAEMMALQAHLMNPVRGWLTQPAGSLSEWPIPSNLTRPLA